MLTQIINTLSTQRHRAAFLSIYIFNLRVHLRRLCFASRHQKRNFSFFPDKIDTSRCLITTRLLGGGAGGGLIYIERSFN